VLGMGWVNTGWAGLASAWVRMGMGRVEYGLASQWTGVGGHGVG
jgi:hypothetical protein